MKCKRCGGFFECRGRNIQSCECNTVKLEAATRNFLRDTTWGCLCTNCLVSLNSAVEGVQGKDLPKPEALQEGIHYYISDGLWVFTEHYHLLRGYCCKNRCRHCPYGHESKI